MILIKKEDIDSDLRSTAKIVNVTGNCALSCELNPDSNSLILSKYNNKD